MNRFEIDERIDLILQIVQLSRNWRENLINLVNFDLVNSDFSFNFLKFTQSRNLKWSYILTSSYIEWSEVEIDIRDP